MSRTCVWVRSWSHIIFHKIPFLWRLHLVHHADLDLDASSGVRFHPLEMLLSMALKVAAVIALGAPGVAVFIFEVLLNATSVFNHGNVRMPRRLEAVLRWIVVTPDMHRVHHSAERQETDSNFGFNLPLWDRIFGTYRAEPEKGHDAMTIGLHEYRDPRHTTGLRLLTLPFQPGTRPHDAEEKPR